MFQNNLKIAFRSLLRRRTFTAINITGLALGMTAAIFAFLWVQNEMSFDSYHQNADTIYRVNNNWKFEDGTDWKLAKTPLPIVEVINDEVPGVLKTKINHNCLINCLSIGLFHDGGMVNQLCLSD